MGYLTQDRIFRISLVFPSLPHVWFQQILMHHSILQTKEQMASTDLSMDFSPQTVRENTTLTDCAHAADCSYYRGLGLKNQEGIPIYVYSSREIRTD